MATFLEQYQGFLETEMATGGTPEHMETCVNEYNAAGKLGYRAAPLYVKWASETTHLCTSCQAEFKWAAETPPDPTMEVTCESCQAGPRVEEPRAERYVGAAGSEPEDSPTEEDRPRDD